MPQKVSSHGYQVSKIRLTAPMSKRVSSRCEAKLEIGHNWKRSGVLTYGIINSNLLCKIRWFSTHADFWCGVAE